ncbi:MULTISPECIES: M23 family metallopeptidase [Dysgonomonas]|uniref:Murein DD-endopeptidase MepM/ murein hydrolase activator NlpD n=1 Tax=Dysgonomonas hofstadii TaxID=637886 RepID=A0A840CS17_9BACT|nr:MULTISPECIES: M23 family metallopeptidase [Dysgonomonas]MBB4038206.1 murein DD-endopeptidase MepM/ murein hydrolase activator NlpD [Dysgonomonas hofstadii]MBS5908627.1 M23 family metallopeptidase [Dysgonomonas mossii]
MKYITILLITLLHLPAWGQQSDSQRRKSQIEKCTKPIYSVTAFYQIADSLQMTIDELSDYPVISPIKKSGRISSGFGMRKHPCYKRQKFHTGIDIPQVKGTPVYATGNGIVIGRGYDVGYGYFIEIQHTSGFRSFYGHLSRILVNVGDRVSITQQIACVGSTGVTTGSHLHYEIRKGRRYLNPIGWCYLLFKYFNDDFL